MFWQKLVYNDISFGILSNMLFSLFKLGSMFSANKMTLIFSRHAMKIMIMAALFCIYSMSGVIAAEKPAHLKLDVSKTSQNKLVFDWPKMTGYKIRIKDGMLEIVFADKTTDLSLATAKQQKSALIDKMRQKRDTAGRLSFQAKLKQDVTYKHYRIQKNIIVELTSKSPIKEAVKPKKEAKKVEKPVSKPEKPVKTAETKKIEKEISDKLKETGGKTDKTPILKDVMAQIKVDEVEKEPLKKKKLKTYIHVSTVDPANLSVFQRAGYLWIVMDTLSGGIEPLRTGPLSGLLGKPTVLSLDQGVAYRYQMPANVDISVEHTGTDWKITLSDGDLIPVLSAPHILTKFEKSLRRGAYEVQMKKIRRAVHLHDPIVGDDLYVIPTRKPGQSTGMPYENAEVKFLPTYQGLVIKKLHDDVDIVVSNTGVDITAPHGLSLTRGGILATTNTMTQYDGSSKSASGDKLFDLKSWEQGGIRYFLENRRRLDEELTHIKNPYDRSEVYMQMALLHFANNMNQETLGLLRLAALANPNLLKKDSFLAIRGAAHALSGHYYDAMKDLSGDKLKNQLEAKLWRGVAAAATEQWTKAVEEFPKDNRLVSGYPAHMAVTFTVYMAESNLRIGEVDRALSLLNSLSVYGDEILPRQEAGIQYLRGEAARQKGNYSYAIELWEPIAAGKDRLYHAKAGLALTTLKYEEKEISEEEALEELDKLRYAWRGDSLEVHLIHQIGLYQIKMRKYKTGLNTLRYAVKLAKSNLSDTVPIVEDMRKAFYNLYVKGDANNLPTLEAIALYDEFGELIPSGVEGRLAVENFVKFLVKMDLLGRASSLLETELRNMKPSLKKTEMETELASIYLTDGKAAKSIPLLSKDSIKDMPDELRHKRGILLGKSYAEANKINQAIAVLQKTPTSEAKRLMADILWHNSQWAQTAKILESFLPKTHPTRISRQEARDVLNAAVAYKLAGDKENLNKLKMNYGKIMVKTEFGPSFTVITRADGGDRLTDRETLNAIAAEVDIFDNFMENYRKIKK